MASPPVPLPAPSPAPAPKMENILVPVELTTFSLSPKCCDSDLSKIAPITQPNYIGLRLDEHLIQHDVLDHIDFHLTSPSDKNPRVSDLGTESEQTGKPELRMNRLGVYLHWSLPRMYRSGTQQADKTMPPARAPDGGTDMANPTFRKVPNRWLVVRRLKNPKPAGKLPDFQTWVIESDQWRSINDIDDEVDLETDVTPFVKFDSDANAKDANVLKTQAEVFLGQRKMHSGWKNFKKEKVGWAEGQDPKANHVELTVMNSSNPLFADYVPHNGSVFSMVDSFAYRDSLDQEFDQHLESAEADYFVVGWHSKAGDEPLAKDQEGTLEERLKTLLLEMDPNQDPNQKPDEVSAVLKLQDHTRVLMFGAIYSVKYDLHGKPDSLADEVAKNFTPIELMEPLSVGTTPLDAILAFLDAHKDNKESIEHVFGIDTQDVTKNLIKIASLLYAVDDSYDASVKAQDMLYTNNWRSSQGGFEWHFAKDDVGNAKTSDVAQAPSKADLDALKTLNENQRRLDVINRQIQTKRWELFAEWWKYLSNRNDVQANKITIYQGRVNDLKETITKLETQAARCQKDIDKVINPPPNANPTPPPSSTQPLPKPDDPTKKSEQQTPKLPFKRSPQPSFYDKRDPTLCIAGIDSGWPKDYIKNNIQVLLESRYTKDTSGAGKIFGTAPNPVPIDGGLRQTCEKILTECISRLDADLGKVALPQGFKRWGGDKGTQNPFHPMFLEWEAQYYHIDRSHWNIGLRPSPVGHAQRQVRFGLDEDLSNDKVVKDDVRVVSGRVLILPQPVFTLDAIVNRLLEQGGPDVDELLEPTKDDPNPKKKIKDKLGQLKFISAPLTGLTEHLLTRYIGTHVTPNVRVQKKGVQPLKVAVDEATAIGFDNEGEWIKKIDLQSAATPYGNLLNFPDNMVPFKGVTNGQMLFTKLNIVDKFGQAICLPAPTRPKPREEEHPPPSVHPCMSDYISPDIIGGDFRTGKLNIVYPEPVKPVGNWPLCSFMQLPPSINQSARINAYFMNPTDSTTKPFWKEANPDVPENPVFGWIVINYQDYGLQFFLPNGTFYREIRNRWDSTGHVAGTNVSAKWIPFDAPKNKNTGTEQLDKLIDQFVDAGFLQGFFDMINGAIKTMPFPPSDYAAFANSLVGKPLALVNVGWSLELAEPAIKAQNTLGNLPADEATELASYEFPFMIGDPQRSFDGIVGYFANNKNTGKTIWDEMYTYFPTTATNKIVAITPHEFPKLSPKYIDPVPPYNVAGVDKPTDYKSYSEAREGECMVTTLLIDPYTSLHAYSPILPIKYLQLPPWTIQKAFTRMTAFFRLGPQLITADVPREYNVGAPLNPDTWATKTNPNVQPDAPPIDSIKLPIAGKKGLWQWLQPYDVDVKNAQGKVIGRETKFNSLDVVQEDNQIGKDPAPFTFVEGYLQLARPLLKEDVPLQ